MNFKHAPSVNSQTARTWRTPRLALALAAFLFLVAPAVGQETQRAAPKILEVELRNERLYGMPVHWGSLDAAVLAPSGRFHLFDIENVKSHRVTDQPFRVQSVPEARARLQAELGSNFETRISGPYVIATPVGESARWEHRFNALLSGYSRYFGVRGWSLRQPEFPLIVVVFPTRDEFVRYAAQQGSQIPDTVVGSYFPQSNRCVLYQIPGYRGTNWSLTEATVVHEAVHQLAYNTGAHERLFENPLWFVEGLATMFEVPTVYELGLSRSNTADRLHAEKLTTLAPLIQDPKAMATAVSKVIADDRLFESDPQMAYAVAWAMTFYLSERMPSSFQSLTNLQTNRRFGQYNATERMRDFRKACNMSPAAFALQMCRFFEK